MTPISENTRKIIHVDMDCFYAAIEIRDNPALADKPVAVGGPSNKHGVICTANYIARQYGIHSAMPTATAHRHCKDLILLPVDMSKYKLVAKKIHAIFHEITHLVEPLALDEAYLDVTNSMHHNGSATLIAQAIRAQIWETEKLTASAGVAPNKFLAKIASGWKKPNGLFVIRPDEIDVFVKNLAVNELFGVGKVTAEKLHKLGLKTCADLRKFSHAELLARFGKLGERLYEQCHGIDHRLVQPNRSRKSLSVEQTFADNRVNIEACTAIIAELGEKLKMRLQESAPGRIIKNQYIKIKFNDFKQTTAEIISHEINLEIFLTLFRQAYVAEKRSIRLLGVGVHFSDEMLVLQQSLL